MKGYNEENLSIEPQNSIFCLNVNEYMSIVVEHEDYPFGGPVTINEVDNELFSSYFKSETTEMDEDYFVLTDEGKKNLKTETDIVNFCIGINMTYDASLIDYLS